ncbi:MAG: hypothetical protein H7328_09060 [Bdellovibrio sp.]|nr:hypothetical protein [Bdellovibrio sp.]
MQSESGPLVWSEDLISKQIPFKASCFICRSNELRAIRADWSGIVKTSLIEKVKINSYGKIVEHTSHAELDKNLDVVFRDLDSFSNET